MDERRSGNEQEQLLGQLGIEPMTLWVYNTKSDPVNSCPYNGFNTRNCDQLNDGKMPKGPKTLDGIVAADCNYKCVCMHVCVCAHACVFESVIIKSHSKELGACGCFLISLGAHWNISSANLFTETHTDKHSGTHESVCIYSDIA